MSDESPVRTRDAAAKGTDSPNSKRKKKSKHETNLEGTDFGDLLKNRSAARASAKMPQRVAAIEEIREMHECFTMTEQETLSSDQVESILFSLESAPQKIQVVFLTLPKIKDEPRPKSPAFWQKNRISTQIAQFASNTLRAWAFEEEAVDIMNLCATQNDEANKELHIARQGMRKQPRFQEPDSILEALENSFAAAEPCIEALERGRQKLEEAIQTALQLEEFVENLSTNLGCNERSTTPIEGVEFIGKAIQIIIALLQESIEFSRQNMEQAEELNRSLTRTAEIADGFRKSYVRPVSKEEGQRRAMKRNLSSQEKYFERMKKAQESKAESERINRQNEQKWLVSNTSANTANADSKDTDTTPNEEETAPDSITA